MFGDTKINYSFYKPRWIQVFSEHDCQWLDVLIEGLPGDKSIIIVIVYTIYTFFSPCSKHAEDGRCICRNTFAKLKSVVFFLKFFSVLPPYPTQLHPTPTPTRNFLSGNPNTNRVSSWCCNEKTWPIRYFTFFIFLMTTIQMTFA